MAKSKEELQQEIDKYTTSIIDEIKYWHYGEDYKYAKKSLLDAFENALCWVYDTRDKIILTVILDKERWLDKEYKANYFKSDPDYGKPDAFVCTMYMPKDHISVDFTEFALIYEAHVKLSRYIWLAAALIACNLVTYDEFMDKLRTSKSIQLKNMQHPSKHIRIISEMLEKDHMKRKDVEKMLDKYFDGLCVEEIRRYDSQGQWYTTDETYASCQNALWGLVKRLFKEGIYGEYYNYLDEAALRKAFMDERNTCDRAYFFRSIIEDLIHKEPYQSLIRLQNILNEDITQREKYSGLDVYR